MPGMKTLRVLALALLALLLAAPAWAAPSLWHIKGRNGGEMWLFGSVHILPPDMAWRSPEISAAIAKADTFVFEVPQDEATMAKVQDLILTKGFLPAGETLREQLPDAARRDFDAAVTASGLTLEAVNRQRPWLAALQMLMAQLARQGYAAQSGADTRILADAAGREVRYLETIEQQFALLAPDDRKLELEEFQASLEDLRDAASGIAPMVDAWRDGDQVRLEKELNGDLDRFPAARKALLDDRNARWLPQLRAMLKEKRRILVTVGAGHLTGPKGLPALLRQAGYSVEGP